MRIRRALVLACLALAWVTVASAQTTTSSLKGTVKDLRGLPVEGASVRARSVSRGESRTTTSDREGRFHFDLLKPGLRLGLGNPAACQIGRTSEAIFRKAGIDLEAVKERTVFSSITVNELGVQIEAGQVDATIVWDAIAACHAKAGEIVPIPPGERVISRVGIAVLSFSENKGRADEFARFLQGEEARAIFLKHQYRVTPPEEAAGVGAAGVGPAAVEASPEASDARGAPERDSGSGGSVEPQPQAGPGADAGGKRP